jgi:hypothetical protein
MWEAQPLEPYGSLRPVTEIALSLPFNVKGVLFLETKSETAYASHTADLLNSDRFN